MRRRTQLAAIVFVAGLLVIGAAAAQAAPQQAAASGSSALTLASLAGKYEGSAMSPDGPESFVADLKVDGGVVTGVITTTVRVITVKGGHVSGDRINLSVDLQGMPGSITGALKEGTFVGQWVFGEDSGSFTMKRTGATGPAAGSDQLTGAWDAVLDMGGNQMPFSLSLKIDGQKVSGQVGSAERGMTPLEGTWVNGTLDFAFTMADGMRISMSATFADDKLTGTMKLGDGQMTGGWAASRRK